MLADELQRKLNSSIDHIDTDSMTDMFQQMADGVAREIAHNLQLQMVSDIRRDSKALGLNDGALLNVSDEDGEIVDDYEEREISNQISLPDINFGPVTLPAANQARSQQRDTRLQRIFAIVTENGPLSRSDIAELLGDDVDPKTISNDLRQLADDGLITNVNRKWQAMTVSVNGTH